MYIKLVLDKTYRQSSTKFTVVVQQSDRATYLIIINNLLKLNTTQQINFKSTVTSSGNHRNWYLA